MPAGRTSHSSSFNSRSNTASVASTSGRPAATTLASRLVTKVARFSPRSALSSVQQPSSSAKLLHHHRSASASFACRSLPKAAAAAASSSALVMSDPLAANIAEAAATGGPRVASIRTELRSLFATALEAAFPELASESSSSPGGALCPAVSATTKKDAKFGDYQCNNAMGVFGRLKGREGAPRAPRDVAARIVAALPPSSSSLLDPADPPSLAGPGFINVRLSREALAERLGGMLVRGPSTWAPALPAGVSLAVVDFSSPNVAKEMHVGHLRSTIIGDCLANLLEFCGADVLRLNHVGDWGTQFGMLIQHIAESREGGLDAATDEDVADLQALYKASKKRFDADEDFKARARAAVTKLQGGDPQCEAAWKRICEASRREFEAIYQRLGVEIQERGESFYNPMLPGVIKELQEAGVAVEDNGAQVVWCEGHDNPLIVQKSDGGFGYATTDLAALKQRVSDEKADWIIYVTDAGQSTHFKQVFDAAKKAGFIGKKGTDDEKSSTSLPRIDHVGFGLVLGSDGKRIRTRDEGAAVRLVELLDEAVDRCASSLKERCELSAERAAEREAAGEEVKDAAAAAAAPVDDEATLAATAKAMGYGAVKYADLKNNRMTNYKFSFDDMLDLKGDTAVYLLYAHARIASIVRKAGKDVVALAREKKIVLGHDDEQLALAVARFPEAVEEALCDLSPNRLCDYLYSLTEAFNQFYGSCKVIGSEEEESRLLLCEATAVVMRQVFALLGLTPLYRL